MNTLFGCAQFLNFVSFLLYPTEVKRLKCAILGAFIVIDITHIDKICDYVGQKFKFLCKLIGCEAQEGAE